MTLLRNALLLVLVLATATFAGWEHDLAVADKLLESGYYEAAIEDYQKIVTAYPDQVPAVDRAWFGMGRAYHVTGNMPAAKVALEKCLERNLDEAAATGARQIYRQMKEEASLQKQEMEKAVQFFEGRYHNTSWLNIITKLFDYFDLRKARKQYAEAEAHDNEFDPRYLIDAVGMNKPAEGQQNFTLTADEMDKMLNKIATNQTGAVVDTAKPAEEDTTATDGGTADATVQVETPAEETTTDTTLSANPHADLKERRDSYLEAYRKLQEALRGKNQLAIQEANEAFQKAQQSYKEAQQAVAAMQNP